MIACFADKPKTKEVIDSNLLLAWGGVFKHFEKDEFIFREGQTPHFYHQVLEGKIKMYNTTEEGKEFIQGFFTEGYSFGEPPLFSGHKYPASAIAAESSVIIRLHIDTFRQMLKENFDTHLRVTALLAERVQIKSAKLKEISCHNPEHRILSILNNYKKERATAGHKRVKVDFTRQEIADMSGLRVETVIRAMRHLHDENVLIIEKGKVYF